jgi:hypothetical protein
MSELLGRVRRVEVASTERARRGLTEAAAAAREIAAQLMAKHDADAEDKAAAMAMGLFARLIDLQARSVGSGS